MIEAGFRPWIGPQYARPDNIFKRRILVLGESHYGPYGTEHPDDTINTVQLFTQGGARHAFFTKIAKVLLGLNETHWLSNKDLKEAFDNIAFYNYIPQFAGEQARQRPTPAMWDASREPFSKTLELLQPHLVIILGKALNHHVPELPEGIHRCFIQHPSTGFSYAQWGSQVAQAIRQAHYTTGAEYPHG